MESLARPHFFNYPLSSPASTLFCELGLPHDGTIPTFTQLNQLNFSIYGAGWRGPEFVDDGVLAHSELYYETFIAQNRQVPTRHNWHDAFNALIWLQFPQVKQQLNELHMADIERYGVHPRTPRRNQLTHFDECGVVIAIPENQRHKGLEIVTGLANHQWHQALLAEQEQWGRAVLPFIFGHAVLEMLLDPFIGLTAKWLAVMVPDDFVSMGWLEQRQCLDQRIHARIQALDNFIPKHLLRPLPVLGVPGWYHGQNADFYANQDYFRPLRQGQGNWLQLENLD